MATANVKPAKRRPQSYRTVRKRVASLKSPIENVQLYAPIEATDDNVRFADSIKTRGLHEPLVITRDNYVVSGNRRLWALKRNGQVQAPCRVMPLRWEHLNDDQRVALLREHNRQRYKSVAEQVREELVDINPADAHERLLHNRAYSGLMAECNGVQLLEIEGKKKRHRISGQKADHVRYIKKVIYEDRKDYWPLSVRGVHYPLLNYTFRRNIPQDIWYKNDDGSYDATGELLTRLRLNGVIPWEALDDETRPLTTFPAFSDVREFVRLEADRFLDGYWRDLQQTQLNHVEVVCEKNTIYKMVLRVTSKYQIPTSSGRGFNSIDPWHDMFLRYERSGKDRLIVIVLSDYDPEGEMIPLVGGRTLRDDFGVDSLQVVKAGVTRDQIEKYKLPTQNFAKESSSNYKWFVKRNDGDTSVYELEALNPRDMLSDLDLVIRGVLDMNLFNKEVEREAEESAYLEASHKTAMDALKGLGQ